MAFFLHHSQTRQGFGIEITDAQTYVSAANHSRENRPASRRTRRRGYSG